jgi:hypothetical protein
MTESLKNEFLKAIQLSQSDDWDCAHRFCISKFQRLTKAN